MTAPAAMAQDKPTPAPEPVRREVIAVVPRDWPPQYSLDKNGNPTGFAIDVMNEIAARANLTVTYRVVDSFAAVEEAMAAGRGDIIPNSGITRARGERFAYTAPVQVTAISVIVRPGTAGIQSLGDLAGHDVGIVETSVGKDIVRPYPSIHAKTFRDSTSALFGLLSGQVDAVIYARSVMTALARQAGVEDRIEAVGEPVMEIKRAIRVRKDRPELLAALDKAVDDFVGTPDYQRIYAKWYGKPMPFWTGHRFAWAAGSILAALLIVFALWRYRLMVRMNRRIAASEEKFRDLIEGAVPGVLIHRDHKPLFVNRSYARIFGYDSPEEIMRQTSALDHVAPQERARLKGYAAARLGGGKPPAVYEFQGARKDGTLIWLENRGRVVDWEGAPAIQRTVVDVTEKRRAEAELMLRSSQQAVVAELGQRALVDDDLDTFMSTTVTLVAKFLESDLCSVLELAPDGKELLLRAGVGWKPGLVGTAMISAGPDLQAGFALSSKEPIVVADWRVETRLQRSQLLEDHGVRCGVTVIIGDPERPLGVLGVHRKMLQAYSEDDVLFLKTIAVMLASAISRRRVAGALRASEDRLRGALESLQEGFALFDADDRLVMINDVYRRINPNAQKLLEKGATFDDLIRANVERGMLADAVGHEQEFINERLAQHRDPKVPIIRRFSNGNWYIIKETRTPEGGIAVTFSDVTELMRTEEALRDSREQFRGVVDASPSTITLRDREGRFLLVNRAFADWMAMKPGEIVGKNSLDLFPDQHEKFVDLDREIYETGDIGTTELTVRYGDGKTREVLLTKGPVRSAAGDIVAVCTIGSDVTNMKRADQALRETQQRFQIVVDNLPMVVNVKDRNGRYVLVNRRFEELYGVPVRDIVGKLPEEVTDLLTESAPTRKAHEKSVIETTTVITRNEKIKRIDGRYHDIEVTKFPVLDADGEVMLVGTIATDVTDRKRAEEALRKSDALFRAVVDHSPTKIHIKDADGRYTLINKVAEKLFGVTDADGRGKESYDLFPKAQADAFMAHDRAVIDSRRAIEHEETFTVDGEEHTYLTVKFPILDGDRVTAVGAIGTDITGRKQEERKLVELQAELAHVSRISTMGEMAAGLAHELNQPLTAITNYAKGTLRRLHTGGADSVDLLPIMELVAEQALRAGDIIRKIRGFMNRSEPQKSRIDLHRTIDEVMSLLAGEIHMTGIEVGVELPNTLPPVMADSIQIQQVLLNLIRNAVAAMDNDGVKLNRLEIGAKVNGSEAVEIYVKDNGPGIAPDVEERLFEPFFTTKTDGLGMGLSISRSIVDGHHGRIWASSKKDAGTTFHFTLPIGAGVKHDAA